MRGDGGTGGWFPDYVMNTFQGKDYPQPASATGKRIVVAYGSNPLTNGNGTRASTGVGSNQGATPGNHTPQDIWVGAEDNTNLPTDAAAIAGQGLLDNTSITPIMARFLGLTSFYTTITLRTAPGKTDQLTGLQLSPVPFSNQFEVAFTLPAAGRRHGRAVRRDGPPRAKRGDEPKASPTGTHAVAVDGSRLQRRPLHRHRHGERAGGEQAHD